METNYFLVFENSQLTNVFADLGIRSVRWRNLKPKRAFKNAQVYYTKPPQFLRLRCPYNGTYQFNIAAVMIILYYFLSSR